MVVKSCKILVCSYFSKTPPPPYPLQGKPDALVNQLWCASVTLHLNPEKIKCHWEWMLPMNDDPFPRCQHYSWVTGYKLLFLFKQHIWWIAWVVYLCISPQTMFLTICQNCFLIISLMEMEPKVWRTRHSPSMAVLTVQHKTDIFSPIWIEL